MTAVSTETTFLPFLACYERLPAGGLQGRSTAAFGPAESPEPFIPPILRAVSITENAGLTFVSARGAMGKSYFAERVSAMKQAPLWRLDLDKAVSADAFNAKLSGYFGTKGAKSFTQDRDALILVDALDEARLRVSGVSWIEFLDSLIPYADNKRLVLFGRERVIEDLWMYFDDAGVSSDWFEISNFDQQQRVEYVNRRVGARGKPANGEVYVAARDGVLAALEGSVEPELADSFVGYAPVLDAVVALLANENLANVRNSFSEAVPAGSRVDVLISILESLLDREQRKAMPVAVELGLDATPAYTRAEQLQWLSSDLLGSTPPDLAWCAPEKRADYASRIQQFLRDHPFRAEDRWASPVFSAYVASQCFGDARIGPALQVIGRQTGLLFDFVTTLGLAELIDELQFAALHSSMLAAEWQSVEAAVALQTAESADTSDSLDGELALFEGSAARRHRFTIALSATGVLHVFGPTAFLSVDFPGAVVISAANGSLVLGPECFIRCRALRLDAETAEVLRRARSQDNEAGDEPSVVFEITESAELSGSLAGHPSSESLEVRVAEEIVLVYPWVTYRSALVASTAAPHERAERFVRRLVALLRRHGHTGRMAVFDMKLQGRQPIKGEEFSAVIKELEALGVVSHEGPLIYLQSDWEKQWFSGKNRPGLPSLNDRREAWGPVLTRISTHLA